MGSLDRTIISASPLEAKLLLKLLEGSCQLELALLDGQEESCGRSRWHGAAGLRLHAGAEGRLGQGQHFLHLLGGVVLAPPEDV